MKTTPIVAMLLIAALAHAQAPEPPVLANGYSSAPLLAPAMTAARLRSEAAALKTWLDTNGPKLTYEQMQAPREQLYYLIGERVKQVYAAEHRILPSRRDPVLQALFVNADNLGVFGGSQIFGALKDPGAADMPRRANMPPGLGLKLDGDLLRVRSDLGWSFAVPYYFMIWNVADQRTPAGRRQLVVVSTGTAADGSPLGHSQATLMFFFSPDDLGKMSDDFLRNGLRVLAGTPSQPLGVRDLMSEHTFNESLKLHTEATSWARGSGSYLVAYSGNDGTYQSNRPHFLDFLRSIETADAPR